MPTVELPITLVATRPRMQPYIGWTTNPPGTDADDAVRTFNDGLKLRAYIAGISELTLGSKFGHLKWTLEDNGILLPTWITISSVSFWSIYSADPSSNNPFLAAAVSEPQVVLLSDDPDGEDLVYTLTESVGGEQGKTFATDPRTSAAWTRWNLMRLEFLIRKGYADAAAADNGKSWYLDRFYVRVNYTAVAAPDGFETVLARGWGPLSGWDWSQYWHVDDDGTLLGPGPGGTIEDCECCMATRLAISNMALAHIGVSRLLTAIDEDSREAAIIEAFWETDLAYALRAFPWPFATRYATLTLHDGDSDDPVNEDWVYAYRYPTDCLFARRLVVDGTGRQFDPAPPPFREGNDSTVGKLIYSDQEDAILEYTSGASGIECHGDAVFQMALSWLTASHLAPALARNGLTAEKCVRMFEYTLERAKGLAANEQQQGPDGDAEWIRNR